MGIKAVRPKWTTANDASSKKFARSISSHQFIVRDKLIFHITNVKIFGWYDGVTLDKAAWAEVIDQDIANMNTCFSHRVLCYSVICFRAIKTNTMRTILIQCETAAFMNNNFHADTAFISTKKIARIIPFSLILHDNQI
jgi:hypothetical protein